MSKRTPGPWRVDRNRTIRTVADGSSNLVAEVHNCPYDTPTSDANARFIVRACNSHDELVEALAELVRLKDDDSGWGSTLTVREKAWDAARAALAKARGEEK